MRVKEALRNQTALFITFYILLVLFIDTPVSIWAQGVPVTIWGYVRMPDGSPAVGASVSVSIQGGSSGSSSTNSQGKYEIDLSAPSLPATVTVTASKDGYSGGDTRTINSAVAQIDITLSAAPPPPPPPPPPPVPKKPVSIELYVPSEGAVNISVRIRGRVTPRVSPVYLKVKDPKQVVKEYDLPVGSNGNFSFDLTPVLLGLYRVSAYFPGDSEYEYASTLEYPLLVKARSILNLTISPSVVVAGAENIKINGSLYPPSAKNVSLYYSLDNASWIFFAEVSVTTGVFSMIWEPKIFGDVFIKAEWAGNDTYTGSLAYGRFQTVLPSVCLLQSWVEKSPIKVGEEIRVNGVLTGVVEPETAELIMLVYEGEKQVEAFKLSPSKDGGFTVSYRPKSPGIYILLLEASGVKLLKASNFITVVVLGEVTLRAVNSTGGLLDDALIELKHNGKVASSELGELKTILSLGEYEVSVKRIGIEVFKGFLSLTTNGISLNSLSQNAEFPLPIASKPLVIELKTETYSLSVHVVNEFGDPAGNIEVKIVSPVFQVIGKTGADGLIVFSNIPAGNYTVSTPVEIKSVNLVRNESVTLKGSGLSLKTVIILMTVALAVLCLATFYFARKKRFSKQ
ncbi:MAG: carboxypeptidase-like regulatory domain-containing protein [Crenarchaeota archaeon]|nr:carboxypeptidase-like regulatory domain-containing protein [Thermoproteota archaeon]